MARLPYVGLSIYLPGRERMFHSPEKGKTSLSRVMARFFSLGLSNCIRGTE